MASLSTINNSNPFPQSVSDQLKQVLSTGERQFKALFRIGCWCRELQLQKKSVRTIFFMKHTVVKEHIDKSRGVVYEQGQKCCRADELFREEVWGIQHCSFVDWTDEMYHGSMSWMRERLPSCQQPIMSETCWNPIIVKASPILRKLSNVSAYNFYEFAVGFDNYVIRLAEGFD